ncbi:MAG: hypothetical protein L0Y72_26265 [Gemmataceae bacterium]|nr:hypothetical protein [Gemmataceae bacterium]MCI0742553.1 hypothetical protein [Gemmataceae bacterium]
MPPNSTAAIWIINSYSESFYDSLLEEAVGQTIQSSDETSVILAGEKFAGADFRQNQEKARERGQYWSELVDGFMRAV